MIAVSYNDLVGYDKDDISSMIMVALIYEDESDYPERERISAYFKTICEAYHLEFPRGLFSPVSPQREENFKQAQKEILETFPEFIRCGTYGGRELLNQNGQPFLKRTGKYQIIVLAKDWGEERRKDKRSRERRFYLDDIPMGAPEDCHDGNPYENMLKRLIGRALYRNLHYLKRYNLKPWFPPSVGWQEGSYIIKIVSNVNDFYNFLK